MTVTAPAVSGLVTLFQGNSSALAGGACSVPALIVVPATDGALQCTLKAFGVHGDAVLLAVPHVSTTPQSTGGQSWSWPPASGNSNS